MHVNISQDNYPTYFASLVSLSVIGPCLFLTYINDLPESVKSKTMLFADDTIVYLSIKGQTEAVRLQDDLNKLENWERDWAMEFNPDKIRGVKDHPEKELHHLPIHSTQ